MIEGKESQPEKWRQVWRGWGDRDPGGAVGVGRGIIARERKETDIAKERE